MIAMPAIDLREGACVQLVGGAYDVERVRIADPVAQAAMFRTMGFRALHVVDLDAATGRGENAAVVDALLQLDDLAVTVGGGIRSQERAQALIDRGAARVVVGTRALEDPVFLRDLSRALPGRVVVALDVRGREVVTKGWSAGTGKTIDQALEALQGLSLAGILVTAVHLEGSLRGIDAELYRSILANTAFDVVASGGIGTLDDVRALAALGCRAAVIGMALYTGAVDGRTIAKEFDS